MDQGINSVVYVVVLSEPMKFQLSVSPRKEIGDCTRHRRNLPTSAGIEPTTSGFDQPLLYRLSHEALPTEPRGSTDFYLKWQCHQFLA